MPGWGEILKEVLESAAQRGQQGPDLDGIRLKYIRCLHEQLPKRAVFVYASGWLEGGLDDGGYLVDGVDVHALMEVCHKTKERELDLVLHSPGGSPQAAEQMINYLRTRFDYIRALVPLQAKSAATMIALGCDEIVLGEHSELGPIDPQISVPIPGGRRFAPAIAILRDFQRAKEEIGANMGALPAWAPILHAYAGGLLEFCHQQIRLSQEVVTGWLQKYMLKHEDAGVPEKEREHAAGSIAEHFGSEKSYDRFRTHGRPIRLEELGRLQGLRVHALEADPKLQDAVLSLYHALAFTFSGAVLKIVENHNGARYVRMRRQIQMVVPAPQPKPA